MNRINLIAIKIILIVGLHIVKGHVLPEEEHHEGFEFSVYIFPNNTPVNSESSCSLSHAMPASVSSLQNFTPDGHSAWETFFRTTLKCGEPGLQEEEKNFANVTALLNFGPASARQNILLRITYQGEKEKLRPTINQAILAGFIGTTITNMCSLFGTVIIPFQKRSCYPMVLTTMVGLAVAALCSTALLVLLPEALDLHSHSHSHEEESPLLDPLKQKLMIVLAGAAFFYILEYVIMRCPKLCRTSQASESSEVDEVITQDSDLPPESTEESLKTASDLYASSDNCDNETKTERCDGMLVKCNGERLAQITPVAWMILFGDSVHNMMDGLTIGAGFTQSLSIGITLCISIMLEELPHEFGDFAILLSAGFSVKWALICNFLSSCSAYIGLIIGLAIGEVPSGATVVFALTTGFFLYISLSDMLPEMRDAIKDAAAAGKHTLPVFAVQCLGLAIGFLCILAIVLSEDYIKI